MTPAIAPINKDGSGCRSTTKNWAGIASSVRANHARGIRAPAAGQQQSGGVPGSRCRRQQHRVDRSRVLENGQFAG